MSLFWVFIQYLLVQWRVPPGGQHCYQGCRRPLSSVVLHFNTAGRDWPSRVDLESAVLGLALVLCSVASLNFPRFDSCSAKCLWKNMVFQFVQNSQKCCFPVIFLQSTVTQVPLHLCKSRLYQVENDNSDIRIYIPDLLIFCQGWNQKWKKRYTCNFLKLSQAVKTQKKLSWRR